MKRFRRVCSALPFRAKLAASTNQRTPAEGGVRALVVAAALAGLVACASPTSGRTPPLTTGASVPQATATPDGADRAPSVIQVRALPSSPTVSVVAWAGDETAYGLRADVNRKGVIIGNYRRGDHRLYVSMSHVDVNGGATRVRLSSGAVLKRGLSERDDPYACYGGDRCSPRAYYGISLPDSLLRTNRDSLVVMFDRVSPSHWTLTLRRELIAAYLSAVDSLTASLRRE